MTQYILVKDNKAYFEKWCPLSRPRWVKSIELAKKYDDPAECIKDCKTLQNKGYNIFMEIYKEETT